MIPDAHATVHPAHTEQSGEGAGAGDIDPWLANLHRRWVVDDNRKLQSTAAGVVFCSRMDVHSASSTKELAPWGTAVYGDLVDAGWLKVGESFLPLEVNGNRMLHKASLFIVVAFLCLSLYWLWFQFALRTVSSVSLPA